MASTIAKRFKPLFDRVLVQKIKSEAITKSGIFLPEMASKSGANFFKGKVLSIGEGKINMFTGEHIGCSVKPGDLVIVPEYGGTNIKLVAQEFAKEKDSSEIFLYKEEELLGIIQNEI